MHGLDHAVVRQPTFSIQLDGKVFLCLPDAEKGPQLRSRSLVSLRRIIKTYASVASLPAALLDDPFDRPQEKI